MIAGRLLCSGTTRRRLEPSSDAGRTVQRDYRVQKIENASRGH